MPTFSQKTEQRLVILSELCEFLSFQQVLRIIPSVNSRIADDDWIIKIAAMITSVVKVSDGLLRDIIYPITVQFPLISFIDVNWVVLVFLRSQFRVFWRYSFVKELYSLLV